MKIHMLCFGVIGRPGALLIGLTLSILSAAAALADVPTTPPDTQSRPQPDWLNQRGQLRVGPELQAPFARFDRCAQVLSDDRAHALRGHASRDAQRHLNAERPAVRYHA